MSSSIEQFFNETQAVAKVLSELMDSVTPPPSAVNLDDEKATAIWQAVELLSRAATYIHAQVTAESARAALYLPEPEEKKGPGLIVPGGGLVP